jgi:3-deoxy-D-manno-octulosonic-acid transferase
MTALALYRAATRLARPFLNDLIRRRIAEGKEDPDRVAERRGIPSRPRPEGPLIWLHAASVGEAQSALSLIARLVASDPRPSVLVTTGTVTSARLLATRLPDRSFHQFVPLDVPGWVGRFLDHWRPDLALWMESELWPNLLAGLRRRGVPAVLLNARMSPRSFAKWRRVAPIARSLLDCFDFCLAQSDGQADLLRRLGARNVSCIGNLKYSAEPLPAAAADLAMLDPVMRHRTVLLFASTHEGEERIAGDMHRRLRRDHPTLLTVIVPRHPVRAEAIARDLRGQGLGVKRRSAKEPVTERDDVYLADTMGELGLFYRLAELTVIGNSFGHEGGHNPLEAAQLDCAILYGPGMANFQAVADELGRAGAAVSCADEAALESAVRRLLGDDAARLALARAAKAVADAHRDVVDRVLERLAPHLDRLSDRYRR